MNRKPLAACLFAMSMLGAGAAFADAAAGQAKAGVCVACHGVDGNSVNPEWPTLAGQHQSYLVKQLKAFKSGTRVNALMTPIVAPLNEQDIEDVAAYFAAQSARGLEADNGKAAAGQRIYRGGNAEQRVAACIACHGPSGAGNPLAGYPAIRGQHAVYVAAQLKAYQEGKRETDKANNNMMRDVTAHLTAEEIAAVASYVQGLR
jgi:cytochrome c553